MKVDGMSLKHTWRSTWPRWMKLILKIQHMNFRGKFVVVECLHQTKNQIKWMNVTLSNEIKSTSQMLWKWTLMTWQNAMSICKLDVNPAKFSATCHMSTWQIVRANSNHTASPGMYVYVLGTKKINNRPTNPHSTPQTDENLAHLVLSSIKKTFFSSSMILINLHILSMCYNAEVMASISLQGFKTPNQNQGFYTNNNRHKRIFYMLAKITLHWSFTTIIHGAHKFVERMGAHIPKHMLMLSLTSSVFIPQILPCLQHVFDRNYVNWILLLLCSNCWQADHKHKLPIWS
jgi:hypothetical protein